jgi:RNA-binding protein
LWVDKKIYDKDLKESIKERVAGKVDVQLGKNGLSEGFINEVKNRLDKHGVVKIRVLKSFRRAYTDDVEFIAKTIADLTNSRVYETRGYTIILYRAQREKI